MYHSIVKWNFILAVATFHREGRHFTALLNMEIKDGTSKDVKEIKL